MTTRYVTDENSDSAVLFTPQDSQLKPGTIFILKNIDGPVKIKKYLVLKSWQEGLLQESDRGNVVNKVLLKELD